MAVPIVDTKDEIIAYKVCQDVEEGSDITRSAGLMVFDRNGRILLALRSHQTKVDPGKWGEAASGTVEDNDSYLATIIREAKEELGIEVEQPAVGPKQFVDGAYKCFIQWYSIVLDMRLSEFQVSKKEVTQIGWFDRKELLADVMANPSKYVTQFREMLELF